MQELVRQAHAQPFEDCAGILAAREALAGLRKLGFEEGTSVHGRIIAALRGGLLICVKGRPGAPAIMGA